MMKRLCHVIVALLIVMPVAYATAEDAVVDEFGSINHGADVDFYGFSIKNVSKSNGKGSYRAVLDLLPPTTDTPKVRSVDLNTVVFGVLKRDEQLHGWLPTAVASGPGSFLFFANAGTYKAFVGGFEFGKSQLPYHLRIAPVAPVPEPERWAMMLLGVGIVAYQVRRRPRSRNWKSK